MADEETQGPEDTSWWAADAFSDSPLPATSFDEPLVWPEALQWDQPPATDPSPVAEDFFENDAGAPPAAAPVPVTDAEWQGALDLDVHPVADLGPLAGLGGGTAAPPSPTDPPPPPAELDELPTLGAAALGSWPGWNDLDAGDPPPGSLWADEAPAAAAGNMLVTSTMAAPAVYATADGAPGGRRWPQVNVRPGNAAVIALISVASLVLLGMFLSVRARNEVPTDASQTRPPGDGIAVTATLNTVPLTTTVPTVPPPPAINIADLIPAPDTTGASAGTATTTATTRPTTPSAGASTATTRLAPQTTVTTAAPEPTPEPTTPAVTSPPDTTPTATTRPPTTRPDFTIPDFSVPSFPNMPPRTIPRFPGFSTNDDD